MKNRILLVLALLFLSAAAVAQDTLPDNVIRWSGYAEVYYGYDFNKPSNNTRPPFVYSHNRHNEFNLNLGYLKGSISGKRYRANLALGTGTYMRANYAAEPEVLRFIYEANAGIKLSKNEDLWLEAGIFSSHIGFESAVSKDCWALTRSMLADNSPYFESGARLNYTSADSKWFFSVLALNGWQRIQRVEGNSLLSAGMQVQYKPSSDIVLNYSNFIGTDKPDADRLLRQYHNLYAIFPISKKTAVTLGFDVGAEQKQKNSSSWNTWLSPVLLIRSSLKNDWSICGRLEYYQDRKGVIIAAPFPDGFAATGLSLNIDKSIGSHVLVRMEGKNLWGKDPVFDTPQGRHRSSFTLTGSIAVNF